MLPQWPSSSHDSNICSYTTRVSKAHKEWANFIKHVNISYGKTLNIIGVDTILLQVCNSLNSKR